MSPRFGSGPFSLNKFYKRVSSHSGLQLPPVCSDTPNPRLYPSLSPDPCSHHPKSLGTVPLKCPADLHHDDAKNWSTTFSHSKTSSSCLLGPYTLLPSTQPAQPEYSESSQGFSFHQPPCPEPALSLLTKAFCLYFCLSVFEIGPHVTQAGPIFAK